MSTRIVYRRYLCRRSEKILTGGDRTALPRHQTIHALMDWSYDLLGDRERTFLRRLGAFVNTFTIDCAVAVGGSEDLDELDVFNLLASLADKSLALAETHRDTLRYRWPESMCPNRCAHQNLTAQLRPFAQKALKRP